jgi:predicted TIM-barrel fold metal-dependent hydrolase
MDNAPEQFLNLFLPKPIASLVDTATNTVIGTTLLTRLIKQFGPNGRRYAQFLSVGKSKDQLTVFEELMAQSSDNLMEYVALTLNMDFLGAGQSKTGYAGQLEQVLEIKKQYPDRIHLFLGVDPRWQNNGYDLRRAVERYFETRIETSGKSIYPFVGIKLYPSTGFYVFDERLMETFDWAAENGVPILSHTSYLGGIFNNNPLYIKNALNPINPYSKQKYDQPKFIEHKNLKKWVFGLNSTNNCKQSCSYFLEPDTYKYVFDYFEKASKKLKICLAHFGGSEQIIASANSPKDELQKNPIGVNNKNWYEQIQELLRNHEGAYTDISYNVAEAAVEKDQFLFGKYFEEANKEYGQKILFGTDYFMSVQENSERDTVDAFRNYATTKVLSNTKTLWDQLARDNVNDFLKSKYYP